MRGILGIDTEVRNGFSGITVTYTIDADASRVLPEPALASQHGGSITVRERQGTLYPEQSVYRVVLEVDQVPPELAGRQWRGTVTIRGGWEPPAARVLRHGLALLRREAGF